MSELERYQKIFCECFSLEKDQLENLEYQGVDTWDSVGHMELIAELEDEFDIALETDDIIDFSSYKVGKEILKKYNINI